MRAKAPAKGVFLLLREGRVFMVIVQVFIDNSLTRGIYDDACAIYVCNYASNSLGKAAVDGIVYMLKHGLATNGIRYARDEQNITYIVLSKINEASNLLIESAVKSIELVCKKYQCKYKIQYRDKEDKTDVLFLIRNKSQV